MLKGFAKWLATLLIIVSVTTFVNVIALYWIPINVPLNSFFAVRLAFVAMIESRYYLSFISLLISALLFLSAISIRRKRIILPMLTFVYIMYDYIIVWLLAIDGLHDGYWRTYIIRMSVSTILIVLLCVYCCKYLRAYLHKRY